MPSRLYSVLNRGGGSGGRSKPILASYVLLFYITPNNSEEWHYRNITNISF